MKRVIKSDIFQQYDEYLSSHIYIVQRAWYELLRPYLAEHGINEEELQEKYSYENCNIGIGSSQTHIQQN